MSPYPSSAGPQGGDDTNNAGGGVASDANSPHTMRITHRGAVIAVSAHQNAERAWLADVSITRDGRPMQLLADLLNVEPVTPEWVTEAEALRAGIERGRYLVDRTLRETEPNLSEDAQRRFNDAG